jgi:hypothetical protein
LLSLFFGVDDEGDMLLRNVGVVISQKIQLLVTTPVAVLLSKEMLVSVLCS